jgi:hypothetical protein
VERGTAHLDDRRSGVGVDVEEGVPFSRADTSIRATGTPAISAARASDRADWPTPVGESK